MKKNLKFDLVNEELDIYPFVLTPPKSGRIKGIVQLVDDKSRYNKFVKDIVSKEEIINEKYQNLDFAEFSSKDWITTVEKDVNGGFSIFISDTFNPSCTRYKFQFEGNNKGWSMLLFAEKKASDDTFSVAVQNKTYMTMMLFYGLLLTTLNFGYLWPMIMVLAVGIGVSIVALIWINFLKQENK